MHNLYSTYTGIPLHITRDNILSIINRNHQPVSISARTREQEVCWSSLSYTDNLSRETINSFFYDRHRRYPIVTITRATCCTGRCVSIRGLIDFECKSMSSKVFQRRSRRWLRLRQGCARSLQAKAVVLTKFTRLREERPKPSSFLRSLLALGIPAFSRR